MPSSILVSLTIFIIHKSWHSVPRNRIVSKSTCSAPLQRVLRKMAMFDAMRHDSMRIHRSSTVQAAIGPAFVPWYFRICLLVRLLLIRKMYRIVQDDERMSEQTGKRCLGYMPRWSKGFMIYDAVLTNRPYFIPLNWVVVLPKWNESYVRFGARRTANSQTTSNQQLHHPINRFNTQTNRSIWHRQAEKNANKTDRFRRNKTSKSWMERGGIGCGHLFRWAPAMSIESASIAWVTLRPPQSTPGPHQMLTKRHKIKTENSSAPRFICYQYWLRMNIYYLFISNRMKFCINFYFENRSFFFWFELFLFFASVFAGFFTFLPFHNLRFRTKKEKQKKCWIIRLEKEQTKRRQ